MADENDNTRWQLGDTVHIPLADDDTPQTPPLDDDMLPSIKYRYETHYLGNEDMPVVLESDLPWLIAEIDRLRAREAAAFVEIAECVNEIAQSVLESSYPLDKLPVDHARLALVNIDKRLSRARALLAQE